MSYASKSRHRLIRECLPQLAIDWKGWGISQLDIMSGGKGLPFYEQRAAETAKRELAYRIFKRMEHDRRDIGMYGARSEISRMLDLDRKAVDEAIRFFSRPDIGRECIAGNVYDTCKPRPNLVRLTG